MNQISMAEIKLTEKEIEAAVSVLRSGALRQGKECKAFEEEFAAKVGAKHAITCSSGSAALHLAYMVCLGPGDEILVPSFTFIATASMAVLVGATPVFCDIDPQTFLIDIEDAERKVTSRTRAIAPVHLFGNVCNPHPIWALAHAHDLALVWDAAQAHGALFNEQDIGYFDDFVCYSFYPSKNLFVGEGGMVCTNDDALAEQIRFLRTHGQTGKYYHTMLGLNYRMTDVEAAIGREQLRRLDDMLELRRRNAMILNEGIVGIKGISSQSVTPDCQSAWHQYTILVNSNEYGLDRDELGHRLGEQGIATGVHYPRGLHQQPVFEKLSREPHLPVTEYVANHILALPVHHGLRESDAHRIVNMLRQNQR